MASERIQRRIERLLDEAEAAADLRDWQALRQQAEDILSFDPENVDAKGFLAAAQRAIASGEAADAVGAQHVEDPPGRAVPSAPQTPTALPGQSAVSPLSLGGRELVLSGVEGSERGGNEATDAVGAQHAVPEGAAPPPTSQPTSFVNGRYPVKRFLGEGGKKKVYLAHDTLLDRDVAFALIKTEGLDDAARERITREAQAMGRLGDHPHIVTVYDIGQEAEQPYLVLPLMPGGDVEGLIEKAENHQLPLDIAIRVTDQLCQALDHAHNKGIIHRDVKPGNVWLASVPSPLSPGGRELERGGQSGTGSPFANDGLIAKLGDFGLAVAIDRSRLIQAGMMVGTVYSTINMP